MSWLLVAGKFSTHDPPACGLVLKNSVLCFMFYRYVSNSKPLAVLFVVSGLASYVLGLVLNNVFHVGVWNPNLKTPFLFQTNIWGFLFPNSRYFRPEPKVISHFIPLKLVHGSNISLQPKTVLTRTGCHLWEKKRLQICKWCCEKIEQNTQCQARVEKIPFVRQKWSKSAPNI